MSQFTDLRHEIDHFMKFHPQSPLEPEQREDFKGLDYYEYDDELVFEVDIELLSEDEPIVTMQTSTGDSQDYRRWATFSFEVSGDEASLTIYSNPVGQEFFMPFKDATNGKETYGAGRYMDDHRPGFKRIGPERFLVDFNFAYNPYCAYSPHFSCPLPPRENWLKVPIRAGEKDFG